MKALAAVILLAGVMANNVWKLAPTESQAYVFHASLALFALVLLGVIGLAAWSRWVWPVVALIGGFMLQIAGCSLAYLYSPWVVSPGDELCSAGLHAPIGMIGLWATAVIAMILRGQHGKS